MEGVPHINIERDKSQNILHLLLDRENGIDRRFRLHPRSPRNFSIEFFKCITPNLSVSNVAKPANYIRKFSPDGKYLICFSKDQQSFECYNYLGASNTCELVHKWRTDYIPPDANNGLAKEIRHSIFNKLFRIKWSVQLTSFMRPLYREFSIFTDDGVFVIVASYMPVQEENLPSYYILNSINRMQFEYDLNCYRFYMVKVSDGSIWDTIEYSNDFINLSHNHGVCLHGNMMAVLSMFHQWIDIMQLSEGKFVKLYTIGRFSHGTDECLCSSVPEYQADCIILDMQYGGLKQKLLVGLYKSILKCTVKSQRQSMLRQFYRRFNMYQAMEIYKTQFIDADHLLIRYDSEKTQSLSSKNFEILKFYVVYNVTRNEITKIYPEQSRTLFWLMSNFFDDFRNHKSMFTGRAASSTSNNIYMQRAQVKLIASCSKGETEAAHRLLPQLPISVQSYSASPYLDLNHFTYDDRFISALERPRYSSPLPIRFRDRETGVTKFRVYPGTPQHRVNNESLGSGQLASSKELVAYIFHPLEPFIISIQKLANRYVTNFHIRNEGTSVSL